MYEMQNANKDLKEPIEFFGPPGRWDSNSNRWRQENLIDPFEVFGSSKQKVAALPNLAELNGTVTLTAFKNSCCTVSISA